MTPTSYGSSSSKALIQHLDRLQPAPGRTETDWPGLWVFRAEQPTQPDPTVYTPCLCVVAQGAKQARLGDRVYRYDAMHYLITGAAMPVEAWVLDASQEQPFLSLILQIDTVAVHDLLLEMQDAMDGDNTEPDWRESPPIRVSPVDDVFRDALVRYLGAVQSPMDRKILAPQILREIIYLALQRDQGDLLRLAAGNHTPSQGAARAMKYLRDHFDQPIDVPTLAREVGLSTSSLHHNFKEATTLTPIQYLKRLRLNHARQLLVDQGCQSAEAAHRVGYSSPSQFSREFKRLFGMPPRQYAESWMEELGG